MLLENAAIEGAIVANALHPTKGLSAAIQQELTGWT